MLPFEPVAGCQQCEALWRDYSAVTAEQLRIHTQLDGAHYARNRVAERNATLEAYAVTSRREALREALAKHQKTAHGPAVWSQPAGSTSVSLKH